MPDKFDLQRFVDAQAPLFSQVCEELRRGRKQSHWMWFIFPQLVGLGHSSMARRFAIAGLDEARAYLSHPVLGQRLYECTQLVYAVADRTVSEIFGSPDDLKFRSSMTLFAHASPDVAAYAAALRRFFDGKGDPLTLELLSPEKPPSASR